MIAELGQFAMVLGLCFALVQCIVPFLGIVRNKPDWCAVANSAVAGQLVFIALSFIVLTHAFLTNDFSVKYVAMNSNTALPTIYKVAAVWGAHEGSLLLWCLVLAGWSAAAAAFSRNLPAEFRVRVLVALGVVSSGLLLFTVLTSNPFERLMQPPADGNDLNPLLQDPALALHPPILYMGYVGFSVAFAFAVAALWLGRIDSGWARWTRPWTTSAWLFLTCGIALGSWWAYYELGWGGWWFWDPVENASFMPWLVGTALIHSLAVTEKRGIFQNWTLLLALSAFSLSLLGTFLVRSGVLISVHAFASDPERGLFILLLLGVVSGGAFALYAARASAFSRPGGFALASRETFLLANNALFVAATGVVLFGTLYPLFTDALGAGKVSIGPPYFNAVFLIPTLPLLLLLGFGMHSIWRTGTWAALRRQLVIPAAIAVVLGVAWPLVVYGELGWLTAVGTIVGLWVVASALLGPIRSIVSGRRLTAASWGMNIAHLGVGLCVLGVTITSSYSVELDEGVAIGDRVERLGYEIVFRDVRNVEGPNYQAIEGEFEIRRDGRLLTILTPQKRVYRVQRSPMTEADIDAGWSKDLFLALGENLGANSWSFRFQYKPMIRFIWFGALIMALGGLIAGLDRRYRQPVGREAGKTSSIEATA